MSARSRRISSSSRSGRAPTATSVRRRCSRICRLGSLSSASWVRGMRPAARSASTDATGCLVSQRLAVMECSAVAMSWRRASSPGARSAVAGPMISSRRLLIRHRSHRPGFGWSGSLQVGQSSQDGGGAQSAQSGRVRVPAAIGASWVQLEHFAERRWQVGHQGRPVVREIPQGVISPQRKQVSTGSAWQVGQSGPCVVRRLTGRRRPHPVQVSRLAGSVLKQLAQIGRPCGSRVTGSRRDRQREHSSMRECAMQVRQTRTPLSGLSIRTTRRQPGQVGRTTPATRAACSCSTNRGITRSAAR